MESGSYAEKIKEKIKNLTECAICTDTLKDARQLPCIHTFCLQCLKDYGKSKSPGDEIKCPMCRKSFKIPEGGFEEIQINHFVNKLIDVDKFPDEGKDESKEASEIFCDHCMVVDSKEKATGYCLDCSDNMCATCLKKHKALKSSRGHKMFTLDKKPSVDELIKMAVNNCSDHPNHQIDFYCYDCKTTACVVCFVGEHKEHKCLDVKKSATELKNETDEDATKLNEFLIETAEVIKSIDSTLKDFAEKVNVVEMAITKKFEDTKVLLEEQYNDLIKRLKELKNKREKDLHMMKEEGEQELMTLESFQRYWNEVKNRGSPCDIVQAASSLQKRVSELKEQHEKQHGEREFNGKSDYYQLEFKPTETSSTDGKENMLGSVDEIISSTMMYPKCPDFRSLLNDRKGEDLNYNGNQITGITIHDKEIFLIRQQYQYVAVSNLQNPAAVIRNIHVPGMNYATGLVYNEADSFLYVINQINNSSLNKINTLDNSVTGWNLQAGQPRGLSISMKNNLLVSYSNVGRIEEFDGSGQLIRSVAISDETILSYHAIELRTGNFIINQLNPLHRICLTDPSGKVIQSYGQNYGSGVGQLYNPFYADVDQRGNILVADYSNHNLRVFDSNLKHLGDVNTGGTQISNPWCMCWDKENDRLLVGSGGSLWSISKI